MKTSENRSSVEKGEPASSSRPSEHKPGAKVVGPESGARRERRTHAQRREEAERRILEAAVQVVAAKGSVRMTLAEVGEAAGYSRGLPQHRFGSKAGLLEALAAFIVERFRAERAHREVSQPGLASIRASINVYFSGRDPRRTDARALVVMMTEAGMDGAELRDTMAAYNRAVLRYFERNLKAAIQNGEIGAETDPKAAAVVMLGAMRGVLLQWLCDDRIRMTKVRDELLRIAGNL